MHIELVAALVVVTMILWLTEAIPAGVVALVVACGAVVLGVSTPREAFASFGHPILFMFLGAFLIGQAMHVHGLGLRMARAATRCAGGPLGAIAALSGAAFTISTCMSNAAATAIVLPAALAIARSVDDRRFRAALLFSVSLGASTGGLATPIGTAPNAIGARALSGLGIDVSFAEWMSLGLPLSLSLLFVAWLAVVVVMRPSSSTRPDLGDAPRTPWSRGEIASVTCCLLAVVGWIGPAVVARFDPALGAILRARLPEEVVALLAAALLFCWPIGRKRRALSWEEAARIEWGTILMFGGGLLVGDLVERAGLSKLIGRTVVEQTGATSMFAVVAVLAIASVVLSELASNTAAATLMVPIAIAVAAAAQLDPLKPVMAATMACSLGFMMPISTPPNAMVYATGEVPLRSMLLAGLLVDVLAVVVVVAGVLLW